MKKRGGRKRALGTRAPMTLPQGPNQRWSLDFVSDMLADGRRFRVLVVVDDFTRECLALVDRCPLAGPGQHHVGRGEQRGSRERIARSADATSDVGLSGMILSRREAEMGTHVAGSSEPCGIVDRRLEGQGRYRSHTGNGHEAPRRRWSR